MAGTITNNTNDPGSYASVTMTDKPPEQLGPCRLLRLLGDPGGQGSVWFADVKLADSTIERKAVKVFLRVGGRGSGIKTAAPSDYRRERDLAMQAAPDMQVGDLLPDETGWWFFTMRAVKGEPITRFCETHHLSWQERVKVALLALERIQTMHAAGIIHRDLKPGNLFVEVTATGRRACILDFGLARQKTQAKDRPAETSIPGQFAGTPEYAAPELVTGGGSVGDEQTDLHALGVILHELLSGEPLYRLSIQAGNDDRLNEANLFWARDRHPKASELLKSALRPPSLGTEPNQRESLRKDLQAALVRWLDPVLLYSTHEDSAWRYRSASELIADLTQALNAAAPGVSASESDPTKFHWSQRRTVADPWVRQSYIKRIKTHAGLIRGADGLIRSGELSTAADVLENIDPSRHSAWEAQFLRTRAQPWLVALKGHDNPVTSVAFSPDGKTILTGSDDNTARVWDAASGQELLVLKGHDEWVRSVAFSPDGKTILTGSDDNTARVWDAARGQELLALKGHDGPV